MGKAYGLPPILAFLRASEMGVTVGPAAPTISKIEFGSGLVLLITKSAIQTLPEGSVAIPNPPLIPARAYPTLVNGAVPVFTADRTVPEGLNSVTAPGVPGAVASVPLETQALPKPSTATKRGRLMDAAPP